MIRHLAGALKPHLSVIVYTYVVRGRDFEAHFRSHLGHHLISELKF